MTSEELKNAAAVMLAASEGKEIECHVRRTDKPWIPMHHETVSWDWSYSEYRVKSEPPPQKTLGQIAYEAVGFCNWHRMDEALHAAWNRGAAAIEAEVLRRHNIQPNVTPTT